MTAQPSCKDCSAFTRVAACTLGRSPIRDPLSEGFRHFVSSMPALVASGWSDRRAGLAPAGKAPPCHGAPPKQTPAITLAIGGGRVLEWPPYATAQAVTEGARAPAAALITPKCEKKCQCNGCAASDLSRHSSSGFEPVHLIFFGRGPKPQVAVTTRPVGAGRVSNVGIGEVLACFTIRDP